MVLEICECRFLRFSFSVTVLRVSRRSYKNLSKVSNEDIPSNLFTVFAVHISGINLI